MQSGILIGTTDSHLSSVSFEPDTWGMMQILILVPHDEIHMLNLSSEKTKSTETSNSCISQRWPKHRTVLPSTLQSLGAA